MVAFVLLTIIPTVLVYFLFPRIGLSLRSNYLRISLAWFGGLYITTFLIFLLALLFSFFISSVLIYASVIGLIILTMLLFFFVPDIRQIKPTFRYKPFDVIIIGACLLFSFLFFNPQLAMRNGNLYTSPIYWDFHWHAAVIQNFVYGDNFPPQDESFSGTPMTYHFFGDFVFAVYEALGLNLADAITYGSILAFFFALLAIIGTGEEVFHSKSAGVIAAFLTISSGSGHFSYYFATMRGKNIFEILGTILSNSQHPWVASFIPGNPYDYTGVFFNLFYFLEERHMIFGILYLLFSLIIIHKRRELGNRLLFILGLCMGAYFFWHIYISIMVLCALLFICIFGDNRKKTLLLLSGFGIIFAGCFVYLKHIVSNPFWFTSKATGYPRIDFSFATMGAAAGSLASITNFLQYYTFAYGLRGIMLILSLFAIWRKDKRLFLTLTAFIIPTFILINSIKLSPSIGENHKWLRPMDIIVDLTTAAIVYKAFFKKSDFLIKSFGIAMLFFMTISGIIELMPFLNSKPDVLYAQSASSLVTNIRAESFPKATFIGKDGKEIHLAGRKLFVGDSAGPDYALNKIYRQSIIDQIYRSKDKQELCPLIYTNSIDFVELDKSQDGLLAYTVRDFPAFAARDSSDTAVIFVNMQKGCAI